MLELWVHAHVHLVLAGHRLTARLAARRDDEGGQTTAEYALVLLGAAGIAVLFVLWAKRSGSVGKLLDAVMAEVLDKVKNP